jgi:branched-chain amino acid transport system ATP-binding protein
VGGPHLDRKTRLDFVYEAIGELADMRGRKALLLSGGQQKLVALGRALAIGTKCLLLDEPFEGIAPALAERLAEVLSSLKGKDLTLLMAQSDMNHSRGLVDFEFTTNAAPISPRYRAPCLNRPAQPIRGRLVAQV